MRRLVALLAIFVALAGCSKRSGEPTMFTGRTLSNNEVILAVNGALTGKASYAEVNSEWLAWAYADFRRELSAGQFGVVKLDNKSQCTLFASAFEVYCQKRYFAQSNRKRLLSNTNYRRTQRSLCRRNQIRLSQHVS